MSNNNMKNADMPAMPQTITDCSDGSGLVGSYSEEEWSGLTKREMFAMHADASGVEFDSLYGVSRFIGREINENDDADVIKAGLELKAKLKVMAADALLAELEK